ncbi:MAG: nicotinate-nucleotide adenylyltransferase [Candidatus Electrothrix sp. AR4]|nr:nicotinate-nucleotide adenylyltransferase [Candidatus Electrothrix sp. AR4]
MIQVGVIHGRFQILHNDHLKYLLAGKERCEHLVVGITNPDPSLTKIDTADLKRSSDKANPFTYFQRYQMVRAALTDHGLAEKQFSVVPFPINFPELYRHYLPMNATFFLTIYDEWGERKLALLQSLGLTTEVLWRRTPATKGLSATDIREKIVAGDPWQHLVPPGVAEIVQNAVE